MHISTITRYTLVLGFEPARPCEVLVLPMCIHYVKQNENPARTKKMSSEYKFQQQLLLAVKK